VKKQDLKRFEQMLLERRTGLVGDIDHLRENTQKSTQTEASGDLSTHSYHMADQGTDANEREKSFYFASKSGRFLKHLDDALRRITDGSYGKCKTCDNDISIPRLEAVPHARYCISCKEAEEQKKARG
jgi:RNA polymerase-binding protein DksA